MYKLLLCWRYLRTRYIALASIVSVTLGVATLIVVNSVMDGFICEMQDRIHGILSDVVVESRGLDGFPNAGAHMEQIEEVAGEYIAAMTPVVQVPAMLSFRHGDQTVPRMVQLIGIEADTQSKASDFGLYLQHPKNRRQMSFELHEDGYDIHDHQAVDPAHPREAMKFAGWGYRRWKAEQEKRFREQQARLAAAQGPSATPQNDVPADPFAGEISPEDIYDPAREQSTGIVVGIALGSYRDQNGDTQFLFLPGDDVQVSFLSGGTPPKIMSDKFTVVDFYESKMSEYDSSLVFVPIEHVQKLRGMIDPATDTRSVTSIQIKLKNDADGPVVRDLLQGVFPPTHYVVSTWKDKQGPLLAATNLEVAILNLLLFLIIAVAGFGILAIFFMIVVEKTRDIGILKALGASGRSVMSIFLSYGLALGVVGAGAGLVLGLLFVTYINELADGIGKITGHEVFDPEIYYFYEIPTIVNPFTLTWICLGSVTIAVLASVLPARRAARLQPVEALRYD